MLVSTNSYSSMKAIFNTESRKGRSLRLSGGYCPTRRASVTRMTQIARGGDALPHSC